MKPIQILLFSILFSAAANAAPLDKLAKSDRGLWPHPLNNIALFDFASKMETLVYVKHINKINSMDEEALRSRLGLNNINVDFIHRYSAEMQARLLKNMFGVVQHKDDWTDHNMRTWQELTALSLAQQNNLPSEYAAWYANADRFYAAYAYEQYRLAALFPRITSEIFKITPAEFRGDEYADKRFIMTFDDGPNKNTAATLEALRAANKTGIFFILGDSLRDDRDLDTFYAGMLRAIHGVKHEALTKPERWQNLPEFIQKVAVGQETCWFRPPYGQRTAELVQFLEEQGCAVMLWNIDSQDWQKNISAAEMQDRLTSLILLWRSGIILFHDVHAKAAQALPGLWQRFDGAGLRWE